VSDARYPLAQLTATHAVHGFTCGNRPGSKEIDEYLHSCALVEQAAGLSSVWIATDPQASDQDRQIAGYCTLSPISIPLSATVLALLGLENPPYRSVGGFLLGRLGIASHMQGHGLGSALVAAAIKLAGNARRDVGGAYLAVDPKNAALLHWYERLDLGFRRLDPHNPDKRRIVLKLEAPDR
jgi:ribosomal protein S18 acetylase RimI-like enzyme